MIRKKAAPKPTPDPAPEQSTPAPTVNIAPEPPVRRHTPDAGVKEYGISLDEISRRSQAQRR
jgi:hypothetical protein